MLKNRRRKNGDTVWVFFNSLRAHGKLLTVVEKIFKITITRSFMTSIAYSCRTLTRMWNFWCARKFCFDERMNWVDLLLLNVVSSHTEKSEFTKTAVLPLKMFLRLTRYVFRKCVKGDFHIKRRQKSGKWCKTWWKLFICQNVVFSKERKWK